MSHQDESQWMRLTINYLWEHGAHIAFGICPCRRRDDTFGMTFTLFPEEVEDPVEAIVHMICQRDVEKNIKRGVLYKLRMRQRDDLHGQSIRVKLRLRNI